MSKLYFLSQTNIDLALIPMISDTASIKSFTYTLGVSGQHLYVADAYNIHAFTTLSAISGVMILPSIHNKHGLPIEMQKAIHDAFPDAPSCDTHCIAKHLHDKTLSQMFHPDY